jgi:hypothetical protein
LTAGKAERCRLSTSSGADFSPTSGDFIHALALASPGTPPGFKL